MILIFRMILGTRDFRDTNQNHPKNNIEVKMKKASGIKNILYYKFLNANKLDDNFINKIRFEGFLHKIKSAEQELISIMEFNNIGISDSQDDKDPSKICISD